MATYKDMLLTSLFCKQITMPWLDLLQWAGVRGYADPVPPKLWQSGGKQRWMVDSRDIDMWWFG